MIEDFLKKSRYRRQIILAIPVVGGLFAGYLLVVSPQLATLQRVRNEISGLAGKAQPFTFVIQNEHTLETLKEKMPAADKAWLIEQINQEAAAAKFSVLSVSPEAAPAINTHIVKTSVSVDAEGDYHQLAEFISRMENLKQFVKIMSMEILTPELEVGTENEPTSGARQAVGLKLYKITLSVGLFTPQAGV